MLIPKPDIRIITRKITLNNGSEALAYFAVLDVGGVWEVKFLGTRPVNQTSTPILLENYQTQIFGEFKPTYFYNLISPFYTLDFLVNQLARAPSVR